MTQLESDVERQIIQLVERKESGRCVKLKLVSGRGFPDRTILLPGGRIAFFELKRPKGGKLSPHQVEWIRRLRALGFHVEVIKTVDEAKRILKRLP